MSSLPPTEVLPAVGDRPEVELRRSARRRKTVSARWENGRILLLVPARTSTAQAQEFLQRLLPRLRAARPGAADPNHTDPRHTDEYLAGRAEELARRYLESTVRPASIRWVTNQNTRWGSTTPARGTVRISHLLQEVPEYVLDYVIHHELCHLLESSHGQRFRALEDRYPRRVEAQAFLAGMAFQRARGTAGDADA